MSEETENPSSNEPQKPLDPKPAKKPAQKKPPTNPFANNFNKFNSPKMGNPGNKGKSFKGGGIKKGK